MVRQLLVPVLLAVVLIPDWASAFNPCPPPVYLQPCQAGYVIVSGPVYGRPVGDCVPTAGTVGPQKVPTIIPERMEQPKKPQVMAEPSKEIPAKAEELATPKPAEASPVKAPEPLPIKPITPAEATPIKPIEPMPVKPAEPKPVEPQPEPKKIVPPITSDRIPTPAVPPTPPAKADKSKWDFDLPPIGELPPLKPEPVKPAQPEPAKPELPKIDPKTAEKPKTPEKLDQIPPFNIELPKVDSGVAQPVEANKPTTSNSSPLANKRTEVDVFPRDGSNVVSAKRGVTFVNKSARDVSLTIDGQTATLPSKTVLKVDLPAAFKWQIGTEPERSEKVPDGSPGIDVVIRK